MKNTILVSILAPLFFFSCGNEPTKTPEMAQEQIPAEALNPVKSKNGDSYYFLQYNYKEAEENAGESFCLLYCYDKSKKKQLELVKKGEIAGAVQNDGIDCEKLQYDPVINRVYFEVAEFVTSGATYYWDIDAQKTNKLFDAGLVGIEADGSIIVVYSDASEDIGRYFQTMQIDKNGNKIKNIGEKRPLN